MTEQADPRVGLLKELSDPLRLSVIDRLGHRGPATVSQLAAELDVALPQLSNHLRRLREAGLVQVTRTGRSSVYELGDPGLEVLLPVLDRITGRLAPSPLKLRDTDHSRAHTCYDHLAGRLGVALYRALLDRDALSAMPDGTVEPGPRADDVFASLGIDYAAARKDRRRFAFECLDAVEHAPHLAGALGDAVANALFDKGWAKRPRSGRTVKVDARGAKELQRTLGVDFAGQPAR